MTARTHEQFLIDLEERQPNIFKQYEIVGQYIKADKPIRVKCLLCGLETDKRPDYLLKGNGCTGCKRTNTTEFISKLLKRFPDNIVKYDYSNTVVNGMSSRISYKCLTCGHTIINQCANDHYQGYGCPSCAGNLRFTKSMLVEKSVQKFGSIYDFSVTEDFVGKSKKIKLSCPEHGVVETTPLLHLKSKTGCPKCYRYEAEEIREKFYSNPHNKDATLPYLEKELEGKVKTRKVTVNCSRHGEYKVVLTSVIAGANCLKCSQERGIGVYTRSLLEKNKASLFNENSGLYLLKLSSDQIDCYKLGVTKDIHRRVYELAKHSKCIVDVVYYGTSNTYDVCDTELVLLEEMKPYKYTSPIRFAGCTELLKLDDDTVSQLIEYLSTVTEEYND